MGNSKILLANKLTRQEANLQTAIDALKHITHSFFIDEKFVGNVEVKNEISKMVSRLEFLQAETSFNHLYNKLESL